MADFEDAPEGEGDSDASTVFIVDDDPAVRVAVRMTVASIGLRTREYARAAPFLAEIDSTRSGCVVLDVRLPGMSGLEVHAALTAREVSWPVIFITGYADVRMAVAALRAGAFDFLEKPLTAQLLLDRVQEAARLDRSRRDGAARIAELSRRLDRLTPREREVLKLIVAGQANKAIAATLTLSHKTIETHRANLMHKTGSASLAELIRLGLLLERSDPLAGVLASTYGSPIPARWRR
jgi:FixJ family two-component response regulator